MQLSRRFLLVVVIISAVACASQTGEPGSTVAWSPADDGWRSGIAIAALPAGFSLVTNVANEVSVGHRFEDGDRRQLEVFRLLEPERFPVEAHPLETSNGITYQQVVGGGTTQVFFEKNGVRLGASSPNLSVDELLAIAKSITYDPEADQPSG